MIFSLIPIPDFTSGSVWISMVTLTFLEIVLGIDNIIFITIISSRLDAAEQPKARNWGLNKTFLKKLSCLPYVYLFAFLFNEL